MKEKIDVLLVEDNKTDRRLIKGVLENSDEPVVFETETASSFSQTCQKLRKRNYDVAILDLGLPDSWGMNTLEKLRGVDRQIPVVVLTSLSERNAGIEAIKKGADDYLLKNELLRYNLSRTLRYAIERKLVERKQANLLEELERSNKELKDFARIVSHDLKAPLRGIKMLAEWISEDYSDRLDEDGKENIELLIERTQKMHRLIEGILEYSRVGRIREKSVPVDLNELVDEIIKMLAPPDNVRIKVKNRLPVITGEQTRITQLFQNLLGNAVEYMDKPEGLVEIDCVTENGFHKFSISDNGAGIEKKNFERIFRIFQTLTPSDDPQSTGIGLTIAEKIVRLYGGNIWLESEPGKGTTFFFTFPVTTDTEEEQKNPKDTEFCGTGFKS